MVSFFFDEEGSTQLHPSRYFCIQFSLQKRKSTRLRRANISICYPIFCPFALQIIHAIKFESLIVDLTPTLQKLPVLALRADDNSCLEKNCIDYRSLCWLSISSHSLFVFAQEGGGDFMHKTGHAFDYAASAPLFSAQRSTVPKSSHETSPEIYKWIAI